MTKYTTFGSTLKAKKILCLATNFEKSNLCPTSGRHNTQRTAAYGSIDIPAYAVISVRITYTRNEGESIHTGSLDELEGLEIIGIHKEYPHFVDDKKDPLKRRKASFKGNPAIAILNKTIKSNS